MSDDERIDGWLFIKSVPGGWLVACRLCGRRFKKSFLAANTNYAEAERASRAYADEHRGSASHAAALAVFHAAEPPAARKQDAILAAILGGRPLQTEIELRREAARGAAERVRRNPRLAPPP